MRAGLLRQRITILEAAATQDDYGQLQPSAQPIYDGWACVGAVTGKEIYALGAGFTSQVTHKISLRYVAGITAGMTVQFGSRNFRIQAVSDPDERQRELDLMVLEESK